MQEPNCTRTVKRDEVRIYGVDAQGRPKVEYNRVEKDHSTTIGYCATLPSEFSAFVNGAGVDVSDLPTDIQSWVRAEAGVSA